MLSGACDVLERKKKDDRMDDCVVRRRSCRAYPDPPEEVEEVDEEEVSDAPVLELPFPVVVPLLEEPEVEVPPAGKPLTMPPTAA